MGIREGYWEEKSGGRDKLGINLLDYLCSEENTVASGSLFNPGGERREIRLGERKPAGLTRRRTGLSGREFLLGDRVIRGTFKFCRIRRRGRRLQFG